MKKYSRTFSVDSLIYITILFVFVVFLFGGGARHDIASLVILRPVSVIVFTYAALMVSCDQIRIYSKPWLLAFLGMGMVVMHLIPLPPSIWISLPNRELAELAGSTVKIDQPWRPISMVPYRTYNALFSLFIPLSGLALMTALKPVKQRLLLPVMIAIGLLSAILGVVQLAGPPGGPSYFYRITNESSPVGLFSNRNHHSFFLACCIPLLAVLASTPTRLFSEKRALVNACTISVGIFFILLILVNGSRSGLFIAVLAILSLPFLLGTGDIRQRMRNNRGLLAAACGIFIVPVLMSIWFARSESLTRIASFESGDETRLAVWPLIFDTAIEYFPVGSGFGTFEEVYKVAEPNELLMLTYLNHAHNDWLEIFMTGGLPALLFVAVCAAAWAYAAVKLFKNVEDDKGCAVLGRLGVIITFLLGIASIVDYPLRTPSLSLFFAISVGWIITGLSRTGR